MGLSVRIRLRDLKREEKKKVAYQDVFDASNLNELKNRIVEREIK
ncbi:MAG TPA: hypothetical protein VFS97_00920 [Nitrososphaeraceae archaeon]|nr:hypothetical protein [Nitrososphaeraceae archaeon]